MATELELIRAGLKTASNGRIENNEDQTNKGLANVYDPPPGRKPGTLDAKWGDTPPKSKTDDQAVFGKGVEDEAKNVRNEMIERLFDSPSSSAAAEQKLMGENFTGSAEGHPHSPLLQRERAKTAADETLTDKILKTIGFF